MVGNKGEEKGGSDSEIPVEEQLSESGSIDIFSCIGNLTSAINSLEEIDVMLYDDEKRDMFIEIKERIFKSLYYYTSFLPDQDS